MVRLRALEAGQEAVVDVDRAASQCLAQARREDLHVARQHHQVDLFAHGQVDDRLLLCIAIAGIDRQVVERHAIGRSERGEVLVVGCHRDDVRTQLATVGTEQQIVETMALLAHQHQQARAATCIVQLPVHAEVVGKRGKAGAERPDRACRGRIEMHAQEEPSGFAIAELLGVEDVAAGVEQAAGDAMDDASAVRAGQGEDVVVAHAG